MEVIERHIKNENEVLKNLKFKEADWKMHSRIKNLNTKILLRKPIWFIAMKKKRSQSSNLDILVQATETIL